MPEFVVYNDGMEKVSEGYYIVNACKEAFDIHGFVGVRNKETGKIKEILQGEILSSFASMYNPALTNEEIEDIYRNSIK